MCIDCWIKAGSPEPSEAAKALRPVIEAHEWVAPAGGNLHIVTDDYNCDDRSLEWCAKTFDLTPTEQAVYDGMIALTEIDRIAALIHADPRYSATLDD